jgi:hypothetical protein
LSSGQEWKDVRRRRLGGRHREEREEERRGKGGEGEVRETYSIATYRYSPYLFLIQQIYASIA